VLDRPTNSLECTIRNGVVHCLLPLLGSRHSLVEDDDGDACLVTLAMENGNGCSRMGIAQARAMMM
jgi:hypothetical protein